jgi:phosphonopyruvate decarboxylase
MLSTSLFGEELKLQGFDFFAGVPCSFLKDLINYAINTGHYVAAANEGDAVAMAAGAFLGGKKTVVLMQNSGLTNASSPLTSLNAVFHIPVLGFVSLRGETGVPDEPQHELMGRITTGLLDLMDIQWEYLSTDMEEAVRQISRANDAVEQDQSFFLVVKKNTFDKVCLCDRTLRPVRNDFKRCRAREDARPLRFDALKTIVAQTRRDTILLATTGYTGRELYTIDDSVLNLYLVGSMGCVGSLGLGLALSRKDKDVVVIDGDGSLLMRMGALAVIARQNPENLLHIILDNQCYESTGGQTTMSGSIDFVELVSAVGFRRVLYLHDLVDLEECLCSWKKEKGLTFAYLKIAVGTQPGLARPTVSPREVKERFRKALHE